MWNQEVERSVAVAAFLFRHRHKRDWLAIISTKVDVSAEEIKDLSLIEALQRLLSLVFDKIRSSGEFAEGVVIAMIDAIMGVAVEFIQTKRRLAGYSHAYSMR